MFLQYLANWLPGGWDKSCGYVLTWIKVQLAFACCCLSNHATFVSMDDVHIRWHSGSSSDDGAGLPHACLV